MDGPKREVSLLESFLPDIWAHLVWYLTGEQLGRLMMTGATFLWRRLRSKTVVKSINIGKDLLVFKSLPRFLNDFPSLEELSIYSCGDEWSSSLGLTFDSIPIGVRKLELGGRWRTSATTKLFGSPDGALNLSEQLPDLEALQLWDLGLLDHSWMTHAPPRLTTLSITEWDGTVELPSSLVHFTANTVNLAARSFVSTLPLSMESFSVIILRGADLVLPLLPPSISKLVLSHLSSSSSSRRNILEQLPKSLTCFQVPRSTSTQFTINPDLTLLLPSTLTELDIKPEFPCSAWLLLPPNLATLSASVPESLCTVVSKIVDCLGVQHEMTSCPFNDLPRSITKLEFFASHNEQFCGPPTTSNQSYFPPQLTYLKVPDMHLSPETAKLLPSSLTHLEIGNCCERVCEHLPNSLKSFEPRRTLMSPNLIKFLPKSLTYFRSSGPVGESPWFDYDTGGKIDSILDHPQYSIQKRCLTNRLDWKDSSLPPKLTSFHVTDAYDLGDPFLEHQQLPNLLQLNLSQSAHFSDISIPLLSPYLQTLNLASSSKISGKSFEFLPRYLTHLNLNSSESIFDADIRSLPRALKTALFSRAIHLTDLCVPNLPPHLEYLHMRRNSQITPSSLLSFPRPLLSRRAFGTASFSKWAIACGEIIHTASNK